MSDLTDLTDLIAKWRKIADSATPGPWIDNGDGVIYKQGTRVIRDVSNPNAFAHIPIPERIIEDAAFMSLSSRTYDALLDVAETMLWYADSRNYVPYFEYDDLWGAVADGLRR